MKAAVVTFPGSNCDRDLAVAFERAGFEVARVWHKDTDLPAGTDVVGVPGGFSFGDVWSQGAGFLRGLSNNLPLVGVIAAGLAGLILLIVFSRSIWFRVRLRYLPTGKMVALVYFWMVHEAEGMGVKRTAATTPAELAKSFQARCEKILPGLDGKHIQAVAGVFEQSVYGTAPLNRGDRQAVYAAWSALNIGIRKWRWQRLRRK